MANLVNDFSKHIYSKMVVHEPVLSSMPVPRLVFSSVLMPDTNAFRTNRTIFILSENEGIWIVDDAESTLKYLKL